MTDELVQYYLELTCKLVRHWGGAGGEVFGAMSADDWLDAYFAMAADPSLVIERKADFQRLPIDRWYVDSRAVKVVAHALEGSKAAHQAIMAMCAAFDRIGLARPPALARYGARISVDSRPKFDAGRRNRYASRDVAIWLVLAMLDRIAGIRPTRRPDLRGCNPPSSGCSFLRCALLKVHGIEMTDEAMEAIWLNRDKEFMAEITAAPKSAIPLN